MGYSVGVMIFVHVGYNMCCRHFSQWQHSFQMKAVLSLAERLAAEGYCSKHWGYSVPSHYLNQCWLIVSWRNLSEIWIKIQWFFIQGLLRNCIWKHHHNVDICKVAAILFQPQFVNSLGPSDAIWRWRSWSTLVQVMAWCLTAPSHYLNQCWLVISKA